jgi:hypothetical protein
MTQRRIIIENNRLNNRLEKVRFDIERWKYSFTNRIDKVENVRLNRFWYHLHMYNWEADFNQRQLFDPSLTSAGRGIYSDINDLCTALSDSNWSFSYDASEDRVTVTNNSGTSSSINGIDGDPERAILATMLGMSTTDLSSSVADGSSATFDRSPEVYPFRLFYLYMKPFGDVSSNETSGNASDGFCFPLPLMATPPSMQFYEPFVPMEFRLERPARNVSSFVVWMVDEYGRNVDLSENFWALDINLE